MLWELTESAGLDERLGEQLICIYLRGKVAKRNSNNVISCRNKSWTLSQAYENALPRSANNMQLVADLFHGPQCWVHPSREQMHFRSAGKCQLWGRV